MVTWAVLLDCARAVVAAAGAPEAARVLREWPRPQAARTTVPATLPVLRWLDEAAGRAPPGVLAALARAVRDAAPLLAWRQSYGPDEADAAFLARYGWCELFGRSGPVPCEALAAGILLLGPATHYPAHSHVAQEIYVPLSGTAAWQRGGAEFVVRSPGECIVHASREAHAMRTDDAPLLAFYVWCGQGLGESARLAGATQRPPVG